MVTIPTGSPTSSKVVILLQTRHWGNITTELSSVGHVPLNHSGRARVKATLAVTSAICPTLVIHENGGLAPKFFSIEVLFFFTAFPPAALNTT